MSKHPEGTIRIDNNNKPSLTLQHELYPPNKTFGEGNTSLQFASGSTAWQCAFSADGQWLAACFGSPDLCIRVWKKQRKLPAATATTCSSGNDNNNGDDPSSSKQQPQDDDYCWEFRHAITGIHERTIRSIAFAPILSPLILASASFDGTICIWEYTETLNDWECSAQLEGHENEVKSVAWNETGSLLASSSRDKSIWIWECFLPGTVGGSGGGGDFDCVAVLSSHQGDVKDVKFAPSHGQWGDGDEIVLSASYDNTIKIWAEDAGDWYCAASLSNVHTSTIWRLTVAPGGGRVISCSGDGSLGILKCYSEEEKKKRFPQEDNGSNGLWKCVGKLPDAHSLPVYYVDYAPARAGHGRIASAGGDNRIQIYREATQGSSSDQPLFSLDVAVTTTHGDVNCVCWHPQDGSILASAGDDGTVRLWKYRTAGP